MQASIIKKTLGFSVRSHNTHLLEAANVIPVSASVKASMTSLWWRIFKVGSPTQRLCSKFLINFLRTNTLIPGTLLQRIVDLDVSPVQAIFNKVVTPRPTSIRDGVVDSLQYLIRHEHFIKPYSDEHILATLLTKAF